MLLGGGKDREAGGPIMFADVDEAKKEIVVSRSQVDLKSMSVCVCVCDFCVLVFG